MPQRRARCTQTSRVRLATKEGVEVQEMWRCCGSGQSTDRQQLHCRQQRRPRWSASQRAQLVSRRPQRLRTAGGRGAGQCAPRCCSISRAPFARSRCANGNNRSIHRERTRRCVERAEKKSRFENTRASGSFTATELQPPASTRLLGTARARRN